MRKILTILVPAYNVERFIKKNINSMLEVKNQNELEVLVVDDGSTDSTGKIADAYAKKYPHCIRVIHQPNKGHGGAINTGIREAEGIYFKVVDGDDWVNGEALEEYIEVLKVNHEDLIFTDYTEFYEDTGETKLFTLSLPAGKTLLPQDMRCDEFILMHYYTVRTEVLRQIPRQIDENCYYVDMEYILYPLPFVKSLRYEKKDIYRYRLGRSGQSVSAEGFRKHYKENEKMLKSVFSYYEEMKIKEEAEKMHNNYLLSYYMPLRMFDLIWRHELKCMWFLKREEKSLSGYLRSIQNEMEGLSKEICDFYRKSEKRKGTLSNLQIQLLRLTGFRIWPIVRLKKKLLRK